MSVAPPFAVDKRREPPEGRAPRQVVEGVFPQTDVAYVDSWSAIAQAFDRLGDQRPATCGAYVTSYLLAPLGYRTAEGVETTREDYLAHLAGTVIEQDELDDVRRTKATVEEAGLSDAEAFERFPRTWYGWPLRSSDDDSITGTSPTGTARAIAMGSGGELVTLPVPGRDVDGAVIMTPERFERLLDLIEAHLEDWRIHPIANLEVDQLLDSTNEAYRPDALAGPDPESAIPRERWGVGHFVGIGAFWRGQDGRRWVLLLDSYKARGFSGYVPMPARSLRRAVVREDGRTGGLLLVMPRVSVDAAAAAIGDLGLEIRMWGNGSLEPEGWEWSLGR